MSDIPDLSTIPAGRKLRTDTLADSVLILLVLTAIQRLVGACRAILFCRWLSPEELGGWDMAFSFLLLAGPVSVLALSSCFGRYLEYYHQRQQVQTLLRRTAAACLCLGLVAVTTMYLADDWFSRLVFGSAQRTGLIELLMLGLLAVIGMNYFIDLFSALRNIRLLAGMQLLHSLAFAGVGVSLVLTWQPTAASVVIAHTIASTLACVWGVFWLSRHWSLLPEGGEPPPHGEIWGRIVPFTIWIWLSSFLANLFDTADRYMILHYSTGSPADALAQVGDYHSSRVVPLLFVSVATILGGMLTPHLSQDWEAGLRERVSVRLNLFLKLLGLALTAGGAVILILAPLLFKVAFQGKYAGGLAVLPLTLTYCIWFGLSSIAQNYLWCAEKARLAMLALLAGLLVNIGLNHVLLPRMGLPGAVLATAIANLLALLLILLFSRLLGFRLDAGTAIVFALPALLWAGPWTTLVVLAVVVFTALTTKHVFSEEEKSRLLDIAERYWQRVVDLRAAIWSP